MQVFFGVCGIQFEPLEFEDFVLLCGPWIGQSQSRARFILLATHVCFLCYHSCKHGALFSSRLVLHKLANYTRRHARTASFVRHFKHSERNTLQWCDVECLCHGSNRLEPPIHGSTFSDIGFFFDFFFVSFLFFVFCLRWYPLVWEWALLPKNTRHGYLLSF